MGADLVTFDIPLDEDGRASKWQAPITSKYGVYIFSVAGEIVRVGETASGCSRIAKGFKEQLRHVRRGKERKNYLAYAWREGHVDSSLSVDFFDLPEDPFRDNHLRRALEAEITFQFRLALGRWPKYMSEIHFLEQHRQEAVVVEVVSLVLRHYGFTYRSDV